MTTIQAIYRNGKFEPIEKVDLPENKRVTVQVHENVDQLEWFNNLIVHQRQMKDKYGILPDSTEVIRGDRNRDG